MNGISENVWNHEQMNDRANEYKKTMKNIEKHTVRKGGKKLSNKQANIEEGESVIFGRKKVYYLFVPVCNWF